MAYLIIRAHIAALENQREESNQTWLAEVMRLCKLLSETNAENKRLR